MAEQKEGLDLRRTVEVLDSFVRSLTPVRMFGFTKNATTKFLREDGTFSEAGLTQSQSLVRISFRG